MARRRPIAKKGRGGNAFGVLAELDDPEPAKSRSSFALGPSLLVRRAFDETAAFHGERRDERGSSWGGDDDDGVDGEWVNPFKSLSAEARSGAGGAPAGGGTTSSALAAALEELGGMAAAASGVRGAGLDGVADLASAVEAAGGAGVGSGGAWDFAAAGGGGGGGGGRPGAVARKAPDAAVSSLTRRVQGAHASEVARLRESLDRAELTHKQRLRRIVTATRGVDTAAKLGVRASQIAAKRKARNQAKHA
jgi:hypothetical protein